MRSRAPFTLKIVFGEGMVRQVRSVMLIISLALQAISCAPLCENDPYAKSTSPDGKQVATLFVRGCGATTGWSAQVSVHPSSRKLDNRIGNIIVTRGPTKLTEWQLKWQTSDHLLIVMPNGTQIVRVVEKLDSISIEIEIGQE